MTIRLLSRLLSLLALAILFGSCQSAVTTSTGPSPVKCEVALTPLDPIVAAGGKANVTVSTAAECAWKASVDVTWITLTPSSGQGAADIQVQVIPNPAPAPRLGEITLNGVKVAVSQSAASCTFEINPRSEVVPTAGGPGSVAVTSLAGCPWAATSNASWLSITSGASGNGPGAVGFSVAANGGSARVGTISIADQTFAVTQQAPGAPCAYTIQPTVVGMAPEGGTRTVAVDADSACSWTAATNVAWLSVVGSPTGLGKGVVTISAAPNAGTARTGTLTIAGQTFTVNQNAGCVGSIAPATASVGAAGGVGPQVGVTIAAGCGWTAASSVPWLTIATGSSGTGNGAVGFAVAANAGAARVGTLIIAGQVLTVTQAGACAFTLAPASYSATAAGGDGPTVTVTGSAACAWTAASSASWLTVTSGASGTGNGTVAFTVGVNNGGLRTGNIVIGGNTFTVTQAGTCGASIVPTNQSIAAAGGPGTPLAITIPAGCAWTATSTATWIAITSGASGTGNGTVQFTVSANAGPARTGTIVAAGQTHTVTQAGGCTINIAPAAFSAPAIGGLGAPIAVTAADGCAWTASTATAWIAILSGGTGSGNGSVTYTIGPNLGAPRTGTISVSGETFTVNQAGVCSYSITPTSQTFDKKARTGLTVTVQTVVGCPWTATSNTSWITIQNGGSGSGDGQVTYSITQNSTSASRVGTLTIAGLTFTVTQKN